MTEPKLLQVFLSQGVHGVFEVSIVPADCSLLCTCPGFENRRRCKHVDYVKGKFGSDGEYLVRLTKEITSAEAELANSGDPADWRYFVYMHTVAEVI